LKISFFYSKTPNPNPNPNVRKIENFIKFIFWLSYNINLYPLPLGGPWHDCQRNMGPQLPVERILEPKPCWRKHAKIGVCCASTVWGPKYVLLGIPAPYFGAGLVFYNIIWANAPYCTKISKKMSWRQFSASWNNAKFRHVIPGRRKLAPVRVFLHFWAPSGQCQNSLGIYIPGPQMSDANSKNWAQNIENKVCAH